nr:hypothetical protein [Tanacetum cinerariifolium]
MVVRLLEHLRVCDGTQLGLLILHLTELDLEQVLDEIMECPPQQETKVPQPSSPTHTHVADEAASTGVDVRHDGAATTVSSLDEGQGSGNIDRTPSMPHDLPFPRVNTLVSDEGSMTLNELMVLCIKLSQKVDSLKEDLKHTKRRAKIVVSNDEELEDPSKQGRSMIKEIDQDTKVTLVNPTKVLAEVAKVHTYTRRRREISTTSGGISTTEELVSTIGASMPVSTVGMVDKGKAIMQESNPEQTTTKLQQKQERASYEAIVRLLKQLDEEGRKRIARVHEETSSFNVDEWEDIQATIKADEELALRIQAEEREKYSEAEKARLLSFIFGSLITSTTIGCVAILQEESVPTTFVSLSSPISGALTSVHADLLPPRKRIRSSNSVTYLEVSSTESSEQSKSKGTDLEIDANVERSDETYLEPDIDLKIQAEIDECITCVDALRAKGIDVRVVVETIDLDEDKTGVRGLVEVRVNRVTHPVVSDDIPELTQEGAVEVTYKTLGDLVQRFHDNTVEIVGY